MQKSPWVILVIGVVGCAALVVLSQAYLRQSPAFQIRSALDEKFHLADLNVYISPEGDGYTVSYTADPALAGQSEALKQNMFEVAESVAERFTVSRVRVYAKTPDGEVHKLLYPPEPPPTPAKSSPPAQGGNP